MVKDSSWSWFVLGGFWNSSENVDMDIDGPQWLMENRMHDARAVTVRFKYVFGKCA